MSYSKSSLSYKNKVSRLVFYPRALQSMVNITVLCLWLLFNHSCLAALYADEIRLRDELLTNHNPNVRPKLNLSEPLHLSTKLHIRSVQNLDEKRQVLTSSIFFEIIWKNELLIWNESEYNGIQWIDVPAASIWLPDLYIESDVEDYMDIGGMGVKLEIQSDGTVTWYPGKL